jgi:hypothetical protein
MADGDIWGTGRLSSKWLAVQNRLQTDATAGIRLSQERADLTGRAVAELLRRADRQPGCEALAALIAMPDADPVTRQAWGDDFTTRWGSVDAEIAMRAATRARAELVFEGGGETEAIFWACYVRTAAEFVEARVIARAELEGAPSALTEEQVAHFARQLARGHDAKVIAPRRRVPPKPTEDVIGMVIG